MSLNPSIGLAGIAVQKDRDTPAAQPTYMHGLTGGSPFGVSRSIATTDVTCGSRAPSDARVDSIEVTPKIESLCYPDVLGMYLLAACGKVVSEAVKPTTGENPTGYYKHTFTMGSALDYFTIWSQIGMDGFTRADGCKCDELQFSATGNEHLAMSASFQGIDGEVGLKTIPGKVAASCFDGKYTTTDCDFKIDSSGSAPAEALVSEASFTIKNNVTGLSSLGRATSREIAEGKCQFGVSVTTIPNNLKEYQKLITGSETSTAISGKVVFGSVYAKFFHTDDPKQTLEFSANHLPFTADFPELDPSGNEATIQFSTDNAIVATADESPMTITLTNKVASYK